MRLIIFHLGVYVHCNFAVFMAGEILNCFGVYRSIY